MIIEHVGSGIGCALALSLALSALGTMLDLRFLRGSGTRGPSPSLRTDSSTQWTGPFADLCSC